MYPHLIEVHQNGIPMLMNIDHVICASDKCNKQEWKSVVMVTGCSIDEAWGLDETYDELKQLITNSGCLITDVFGNTGIAESEDALINYPLYRMKRDNDRLYIPDGYTQAKIGGGQR